MTWAPQELQKILYTTLNGDTTLQTLLGGVNKVYDHVPQDSVYPYITLQPLPFTDRGNFTFEGFSCEYQINVWYRAPGRGMKSVQDIQARIDALLHKVSLCVDSWNVVNTRRTFIDIVVQDDNVTLQGIQRFNLLLGGQ